MKYYKIENNIIIEKHPNNGPGLIEGPDNWICGMISDGNSGFVAPPIPFEQKIANVRNTRNAKLRDSDWSDLPNCRLTDAKKIEWATYRDLLFDLPATLNESNIDNFTWPVEPQE